ncbi:MAG TPA: hypothetical protein DEG44_05110 [Candidatus Kerfeldbacteria bacterium]|nr:hypothetical protein [Candidatus Kerfeldbacteria bacterium]
MKTLQTKLTCQNETCQKSFNVIPQEAEFYQAKHLPLPEYCPACRHKHRMALRSERALYRRTCAKCQQSMLSVYPETAPYIVYCQKCYWENIG